MIDVGESVGPGRPADGGPAGARPSEAHARRLMASRYASVVRASAERFRNDEVADPESRSSRLRLPRLAHLPARLRRVAVARGRRHPRRINIQAHRTSLSREP